MSGMIPGVGVGPRRRTTQILHDDHPRRRRYLQDRLDPSNSMDDTALRARQNLAEKLGNFYSIPRYRKIEPPTERSCSKGGSRGLGISWNLGIWRMKSNRKICAICLDDIVVDDDDDEAVMDLSCSHQYHSNCLLPWIADHPHCPCCRTPI